MTNQEKSHQEHQASMAAAKMITGYGAKLTKADEEKILPLQKQLIELVDAGATNAEINAILLKSGVSGLDIEKFRSATTPAARCDCIAAVLFPHGN